MTKFLTMIACLGAAALLSACSLPQITTSLSTPAGQIVCAAQAVGGPIALGLVDAEATALLASTGAGAVATPVALAANGMAKAQIDSLCAKAAVAAGAVYTGTTTTAAPTATVVVTPSTGQVVQLTVLPAPTPPPAGQ